MILVGLLLASLNIFVEAFTLVPTNVGVAPRAQAVFYCQYLTADYIVWEVNDSLLVRNPPSGITPNTTRDNNGSLVDTLTVTARPEFNEMKVVCVAGFDGGRREEKTQPAFLLVGRFLRSPMSLNVTVNAVAEFYCQNTAADGITWTINGSTIFPENVSQGSFLLNITARPEYDQTVITCEAYFINSPVQETDPAVLRIQGCLEHITGLQRMSSTLAWEPPFSLDLTGVDPDIVYCVVIYNITCGRRDLIISDCSVTEPSYTSADVAPDGFIYEYTVTPRSNVEGARNGTNWTVIEQYYHLSIASPRGQQNVKENGSLSRVTLTLDIDNGGQEPLLLSALLKSADGIHHKNGSIEPVNTKRESNGENIIVLKVPSKRVFDIMLLPNSCYGYPLTNFIEIGTHDAYAISVTVASFPPCIIQVMGDIVDGSSSLGILVIVYSVSLTKYDFLPFNETKSGGYNMTVSDVPDGEYKVAIFVVEENGEPFTRAASRPKDITINGTCEVIYRDVYVEYDLHPTSTGVCITCTFLKSSATDCVAVVHQRISQLNSSGLMNIESSHKFTRSGDAAYGCIEGVNLEQYQVGVIGGKISVVDKSDSVIGHNTSIDNVLASTVTPVVMIMTAVIIVACLFCMRKQWKIWKESNSTITTCTGRETIPMFRSITDEPNSDPLPSDPGVEVDVVTIKEQKNDEDSSLDLIEEPAFKEGEMEELSNTTALSKLITNNCESSAQPFHHCNTDPDSMTVKMGDNHTGDKTSLPRNSNNESGYETHSVSEPISMNSEAGKFSSISDAKNNLVTTGQLNRIEEDQESAVYPFSIQAEEEPEYDLVTIRKHDENDIST